MYQKLFFTLIFFIFAGHTGADEPIDNGPNGRGILLKQKFTHLARHLTIEGDQKKKERRTYRSILSSTLQRTLNFLGQRALDHMGVRNLAQKLVIKGEIDECFLGSYINSFSADMAEYAIDHNPFSYNGIADALYGNPLLPFSYQESSAAPIPLTTYAFWVIFLETLDDLNHFLKDEGTFAENKKSIFSELQLEIQTNFISVQQTVKDTWDNTHAHLTEAISMAQEDYKYSKKSFSMWGQASHTSKEDLIKLLEGLTLNYKQLAKKELWTPL